MRGFIGTLAALAFALQPVAVRAEQPPLTDAMRPFVRESAPVIALVNVRVIDGTGAAPRDGQTVILRDGMIEEVGAGDDMIVPADARRIDLEGRTVLPGMVQLHEHLWMYGGSLLSVPVSYPRLLLAAGVTSIRTAGSYNPYVDLKAWREIQAGEAVGPWMDLTIYMDLFGAPRLEDAESTRRYLDFWLDSGFTSVKAYSLTNAIALRAAIETAHARGVRVTGHLCAVTYAEAADMGIDNIEHGFAMTPDFLPGATNVGANCAKRALHAVAGVDPEGPEVRALIDRLVEKGVAITSTLTAIEDLQDGVPEARGLDMLTPPVREYQAAYRARLAANPGSGPSVSAEAVGKSAIMERAFLRAGGLLVSGTDPAVPSGGVIAGFSSARQLELMVENGFTPLEAIRVSTFNGAIYLERADEIGSIASGKQADLMVVRGDPSDNISDIRNVEIVFRQGFGYDPEALLSSVRGQVGLK